MVQAYTGKPRTYMWSYRLCVYVWHRGLAHLKRKELNLENLFISPILQNLHLYMRMWHQIGCTGYAQNQSQIGPCT